MFNTVSDGSGHLVNPHRLSIIRLPGHDSEFVLQDLFDSSNAPVLTATSRHRVH